MSEAFQPPPDLSVVVPVYNERDSLGSLVSELRGALRPLDLAFEIILVDDGSDDGSTQACATLAREDASVRSLHFGENHGQTAAFDAGFRAARGRWIVTLDADLQNDPKDIPRLLAALDDADAAVGYRVGRADGLLHRLSSWIANRVRNWVSDENVVDTGCSLKAYRRDCLAGLKLYTGMHRFLPTLLRMEGWRVVQLPVGHRPRRHGKSKYGIRNRLPRSFVDLLVVRWMKSRRLNYEVTRDEP
jgi:glycosyltransferase involved in cell wall biosynthesis